MKLKCDEALSKFALNFNFYRYDKGVDTEVDTRLRDNALAIKREVGELADGWRKGEMPRGEYVKQLMDFTLDKCWVTVNVARDKQKAYKFIRGQGKGMNQGFLDIFKHDVLIDNVVLEVGRCRLTP